MKTKENIAKELNISRKTLYNYMNELKIIDLTDDNINILKEYSKNKNKSKEISKSDLINELEQLKIKNAELLKQNETLLNGQTVLLQQVEYYKNEISQEIRDIKQNMILLLNAPKNSKRGLFGRFKRK